MLHNSLSLSLVIITTLFFAFLFARHSYLPVPTTYHHYLPSPDLSVRSRCVVVRGVSWNMKRIEWENGAVESYEGDLTTRVPFFSLDIQVWGPMDYDKEGWIVKGERGGVKGV